jgi:UDP-N-acetylglucosamine 1-carboxyvinyltransferase
MRASINVLGPLLARHGRARVAMPGGDNIGSRKLDLHARGLQAMGVELEVAHGFIDAQVNALSGARIVLDFPSVGATETLLTAAVLAKGETVIDNAAREPEICDLAAFLVRMGARIEGAGTPTIMVEGVTALRPADHAVIGDRIEGGTFLFAALVAGGDVTVTGITTRSSGWPPTSSWISGPWWRRRSTASGSGWTNGPGPPTCRPCPSRASPPTSCRSLWWPSPPPTAPGS